MNEDSVTHECALLLKFLLRLGKRNAKGEIECAFATIFDDDECQQTLESLMGTLKAAKKRGIITFEGQLLLKGSHDKVPIIVLKENWTAGQ